MVIAELIGFTKEKINEFGGKEEDPKNYVFRNNTGPTALEEGGAYFGFIHPDEDSSGAYHDFCVVLFPDENDGGKPWLLSLGFGSMGFRNDFELAERPGFRRSFESILSKTGFCKTDFTNTEQRLPREFEDRIPHLSPTLKKYSNVLPVCEILEDPLSEDSKDRISAFLAIYAKSRGWLKNQQQRKAYEKCINKLRYDDERKDDENVLNLIQKRKYVILTRAPGTGKTRLAKIIKQKLNAESFFIQFHAETNYSDFIYGIVPNLDGKTLSYSNKFGVFHEALKFAVEHKDKNVILIVDEINRANLSNILGPIFYLFEYRLDENEATEQIKVSPDFAINCIPPNFFMIGTMNTADRSLAVVDFALRRRFAWYNLKPNLINSDDFFDDDFNRFQDIFYWYANSNELDLQPGQGYFLANNENEFKMRVEYELLPLIREYLQEQLLLSAKEEFNNYFYTRINRKLFE
jgi:5-methylcytosine-specific restriction protein B